MQPSVTNSYPHATNTVSTIKAMLDDADENSEIRHCTPLD
jgi:hypothetical protein